MSDLMFGDVKRLWINALKSGAYRRGHGQLCQIHNDHKYFDALGVLADIAAQKRVVRRFIDGSSVYYGKEQQFAYLPREVVQWAGLTSRNPIIGKGRNAFISMISDLRVKSSDNTVLVPEHRIFRHSFTEIATMIDLNITAIDRTLVQEEELTSVHNHS